MNWPGTSALARRTSPCWRPGISIGKSTSSVTPAKKTGELAFVHFGEQVDKILRSLPTDGPLFPYLRRVRAADRATEFKQRCETVGVRGVTLHSYRYAWAERAKKAGYPERLAQIALGHNSKAVHRV